MIYAEPTTASTIVEIIQGYPTLSNMFIYTLSTIVEIIQGYPTS